MINLPVKFHGSEWFIDINAYKGYTLYYKTNYKTNISLFKHYSSFEAILYDDYLTLEFKKFLKTELDKVLFKNKVIGELTNG